MKRDKNLLVVGNDLGMEKGVKTHAKRFSEK